MSYLQPSTEYVIDFRLVRNANHVKADLEKLSNFSGEHEIRFGEANFEGVLSASIRRLNTHLIT